MANANPAGINNVSNLPPGEGNHRMSKRCSECDFKYSYWEEEGDPGCPECEIKAAAAAEVKARKEAAKKPPVAKK